MKTDSNKIPVTRSISLPADEIRISFIRASGPGGQNVNKVATAVQLRFDVRQSPSLPESVRKRLQKIAGSRLTAEGYLIISASRYRTQSQNRRDAVNRLVQLIRQAAQKTKKRRKTQIPEAARKRRLQKKREHSEIKKLRRNIPPTE